MQKNYTDDDIVKQIDQVLDFVLKKDQNFLNITPQECIALGYICGSKFASLVHLDNIKNLYRNRKQQNSGKNSKRNFEQFQEPQKEIISEEISEQTIKKMPQNFLIQSNLQILGDQESPQKNDNKCEQQIQKRNKVKIAIRNEQQVEEKNNENNINNNYQNQIKKQSPVKQIDNEKINKEQYEKKENKQVGPKKSNKLKSMFNNVKSDDSENSDNENKNFKNNKIQDQQKIVIKNNKANNYKDDQDQHMFLQEKESDQNNKNMNLQKNKENLQNKNQNKQSGKKFFQLQDSSDDDREESKENNNHWKKQQINKMEIEDDINIKNKQYQQNFKKNQNNDLSSENEIDDLTEARLQKNLQDKQNKFINKFKTLQQQEQSLEFDSDLVDSDDERLLKRKQLEKNSVKNQLENGQEKQKTYLSQKQILDLQQESDFSSCPVCNKDLSQDQDQNYVFLDDCCHIYHTKCFDKQYSDKIKQMQDDEIQKLIEQQSNQNIQNDNLKVNCCKKNCESLFNLANYLDHIDLIKQEKIKKNQNMFLCTLCLKEKDQEQSRMLECDHQFCISCLQKYILELSEKDSAIICSICSQLIDEMFIQDIMPDENIKNSHKADISEILAKERMMDAALEICNGDKEQAEIIVQECNFLELGAVNSLVSCQKKALQYVAKMAKQQSDRSYHQVKEMFEKQGLSEDELKCTLKYIRDRAPITINFRLSLLTEFLKDGKYKNLFEVRPALCQARKNWEHNLFGGHYDKAKPSERVKYGALNIFNDPNGISSCKGYGSSFFVMKEVRLRTTFYCQDTGGFPKNKYLATSQYYCHILLNYTPEEIKVIADIATGVKQGHDYGKYGFGNYKEIQIHGDVEFSKHVECCLYSKDELRALPNGMELIEKFSKKYNINCFPQE